MSDLIDRQAILKNIEKIRQGVQMMDDTRRAGIIMNGMLLCEEAVRNQPSEQPEWKKGMENDESVVLLLKSFHGMFEAECSGCGASIYVHPDFVERHRYCFCCGKKIEETVEAIDFDENYNQEEI